MTGPDLLAIGETMAMVTPEPGGHLDTSSPLRLRPGGAESNVAVMASRLGLRTAWASALGVDPLGDLVLAEIAGSGVDVSLVDRDPLRPTGVYFKQPTPAGTQVFYYRAGSAASAMGAGLQSWVATRPGIVHVSAITAAISRTGAQLLESIVIDRAFGPALVSFDVNHRPKLWPAEQAADVTLALARASDVVFVGRDEAERLWGTVTPDEIRALIDKPAHLVVKDADVDAVEYTPSGTVRCAPDPCPVVDLVGAGDAFAAGWLAGQLLGVTGVRRLRLAHTVAAAVIGSSSDSADVPSAAVLLSQQGSDSADNPVITSERPDL